MPDFATPQLRARQIEVVKCMPPGFEFGPQGATVRRLVEQLAQVRQQQPIGQLSTRDYAIAMTFLEDQRGPAGRLHVSRVALATTYLDCLTSGAPTGSCGR